MKKKILFIVLSVILIISFSIISFGAVPEGYTYQENIDMSKTLYCRAFYQRKDWLNGEVLDYVSGADLSKSENLASVRNYFPLSIEETIGLGVSSDQYNIFEYPYTSVDGYLEFSVAQGLWCTTRVLLRLDGQPGSENLLTGNILENIKNTVVLRVNCVLPDGRGHALYQYIEYEPVSINVNANIAEFNFEYFLQINEASTNANSAKIIGYDLLFYLEADGYDFAREITTIYSSSIYSAIKPNYNLVDGQFVKDTTELSQQVSALENQVLGSIIGSLEQYRNYFSATSIKFLEFGNEFFVLHKIMTLFYNIDKVQALIGLSITIGLFGVVVGVASIVRKKE